MRIYTAAQMRFAEQQTVLAGTDWYTLLVRAGQAVAKTVLQEQDVRDKTVIVVCGKGNNGGDGLVAAQYLQEHGAKTTVILAQGSPSTDIAARAFSAYTGTVLDAAEEPEKAKAVILQADLLIDGLFGFGFHGAATGIPLLLIQAMNESAAPVYAIDLPSGAECDTAQATVCVQATHTVTFTALKPACVSYPAKRFCGKVTVADIGVSLPAQVPGVNYALCAQQDARALLPKRDAESNKGTFGKVLLVCGSFGMAGAAMMAAKAALRSGAGLVQLAVEKELYPLLAPALPEAVFILLEKDGDTLSSAGKEKLCAALAASSAVLVGCGLGQNPYALALTQTVMENTTVPLIMDADALNLLSAHPALWKNLRAPVILTPHPGEMARLCEKSIAQVQSARIETALAFTRQHDCTLVLKGAATVIARQNALTINPTGNPGMARGGSGDALAGCIAALCAQKLSAYTAAVLGAYVHGLAGNLAAQQFSQHGMLPTDLISLLPQAFLKLE